MPDTRQLDEGGLAGGPPALQPHLPPVQRTPDMSTGIVRDGVSSIFRNAAGGDDLTIYNAVPRGTIKPSFQPFQPAGADPLRQVESVFTEGRGQDLSTTGIIKDVLGIM